MTRSQILELGGVVPNLRDPSTELGPHLPRSGTRETGRHDEGDPPLTVEEVPGRRLVAGVPPPMSNDR